MDYRAHMMMFVSYLVLVIGLILFLLATHFSLEQVHVYIRLPAADSPKFYCLTRVRAWL